MIKALGRGYSSGLELGECGVCGLRLEVLKVLAVVDLVELCFMGFWGIRFQCPSVQGAYFEIVISAS